jgi:hypothetical protein
LITEGKVKEPTEAERKAALSVATTAAEKMLRAAEERDARLAELRVKYDALEPLKFGMSKEDRKRFEEIGELIEALSRAGR